MGCGEPFESASSQDDASSDTTFPVQDSSAERDGSGVDVGTASDARDGIAAADSGADVAPSETGNVDARVDGGGVVDAGRDALPDVGNCDPIQCAPVHFECVSLVGSSGGGLVMSTSFSVAWRFQVPLGRPLTSTQAGLFYRPITTTGTLFAAIVALASATTNPKTTLLPADVLVSAVSAPIAADAGLMPRIVAIPLSAVLAPGWYAVVFGTDQLGAAGAYGSIEKMNTAMMCENGQLPMSLKPQTGEVIAQSADPYLFVDAR
jgi:hypothetical protein